MGENKISKDLLANAVQTGIAQLVSLSIFYLMSRYISKDDFGTFNWSTALGSTILALGSLGLDLVLIKRISSGEDAKLLAGIHFFHTALLGFILLLSIGLMMYFAPQLIPFQPLFFLVIIQLTITAIANSFKFTLTGLEAFKQLAIIAIVINLIKISIIISLFIINRFSIISIVYGFILTSLLELIHSYYFVNKHIRGRLKPIFEQKSYKNFIIESLPQLGVVIFDSALARVDWILLGIMSTAAITAEYSFAYKFFELSKIPLVILAPVLLTRFSKLFSTEQLIDADTQKGIQAFFGLEIFLSFIIPIFMTCAWSDLIDWVTDGKYGAVNQYNFAILALCVPLVFAINFMWTIGFIQGQLKPILRITITASLFNVLLNLLFIKYLGSMGSAIAYLLSTLLQFFMYARTIHFNRIKIDFKPFVWFFSLAFISVLCSKLFFSNQYLAALIASTSYISIAFFSKMITKANIQLALR
jgi:O-antigen/teichoic acid export membrane protein